MREEPTWAEIQKFLRPLVKGRKGRAKAGFCTERKGKGT